MKDGVRLTMEKALTTYLKANHDLQKTRLTSKGRPSFLMFNSLAKPRSCKKNSVLREKKVAP